MPCHTPQGSVNPKLSNKNLVIRSCFKSHRRTIQTCSATCEITFFIGTRNEDYEGQFFDNLWSRLSIDKKMNGSVLARVQSSDKN